MACILTSHHLLIMTTTSTTTTTATIINFIMVMQKQRDREEGREAQGIMRSLFGSLSVTISYFIVIRIF